MSVLSLLKKVKVEILSFEKHPCRELDQEMMIHYLNGLALITNEDETLCEKKTEYLSIIINSFGLSENMLETFVNFAENPDEKLILDMMQSFATKDIKYNLMVDAMMIANIDGNFKACEKAIIEQYFEMFKITKKEAEDLKYIYEMFYAQNGNALYRYFKRNEYMKVELFQYLLDYYKIDMAYELVEDEKKILNFEFFKPTIKTGELGEDATEIMTKPITNAQFCIYLNSDFMDKTIEFDGNGKVVDSESKDLLMDLGSSDIEFKDNVFLVNSAEDDEEKITGITYMMANKFIEWVSKYNNEDYTISSLVESSISMNSFDINLDSEFFYNRYSYVNCGTKNDCKGYCIGEIKDSEYIHTDLRNMGSIKSDILSKDISFRMMKLPIEK